MKASDICLPTILSILAEYINDEEMCQNLLDVISVLVNENYFRNQKQMVEKNVESLFKCEDTVQLLFEQLGGDNMYIQLVVIDIIRSSLSINSVLGVLLKRTDC